MGKKTRKGFEISLPPFARGWYEETIEGFKKDVEKKSGISLFGRSKKETDLTQRFANFLLIAEKDIEMYLWFAKSFVARNELGKEIDSELDNLFGIVISTFNSLLQNYDPNKLSEESLNNLKNQLKLLNEQAGRLWNLQSLRESQDPKAKESAKKLIDDFHIDLRDFGKLTEPYLKKEETKSESS